MRFGTSRYQSAQELVEGGVVPSGIGFLGGFGDAFVVRAPVRSEGVASAFEKRPPVVEKAPYVENAGGHFGCSSGE